MLLHSAPSPDLIFLATERTEKPKGLELMGCYANAINDTDAKRLWLVPDLPVLSKICPAIFLFRYHSNSTIRLITRRSISYCKFILVKIQIGVNREIPVVLPLSRPAPRRFDMLLNASWNFSWSSRRRFLRSEQPRIT